MKFTKIFVITLIIIIIWIYINYYLKYINSYEILQTNLQNFECDILHEKLPVIIQDKIVNLNDLINKCLTYYYNFNNTTKVKDNIIITNKNKNIIVNNFVYSGFIK